MRIMTYCLFPMAKEKYKLLRSCRLYDRPIFILLHRYYIVVVWMMMHHDCVTQAVAATMLTRTLKISKELRLE